MYCPKCGNLNDDKAEFCTSCGNKLTGTLVEPSEKPSESPGTTSDTISYNNPPVTNYAKVPNYLVWSIINTVVSVFLLNFLALPAGIVAIVFSTQVDSKLRTGDYEGATKSSRNAKIWNWVATGLDILSVILWVLLVVLFVIGMAQYQY